MNKEETMKFKNTETILKLRLYDIIHMQSKSHYCKALQCNVFRSQLISENIVEGTLESLFRTFRMQRLHEQSKIAFERELRRILDLRDY